MRRSRSTAAAASPLVAFALPILVCGAPGQDARVPAESVVFLEPVAGTGSAKLPLYERLRDRAKIRRFEAWLESEPCRSALALYRQAWQIMKERGAKEAPPPYHIALVPRGNHAALGLRIRDGEKVTRLPKLSYIKLDPARPFGVTMYHETGHVVLAVLASGRRVPARAVCSIPHSTAALTNRGTAFNEGFAISLETLAAHLGKERKTRQSFHRERLEFGSSGITTSEYYRHGADLANFAQSIARYAEVRDNNFAFASAFVGPDYLRVQLEKARDFATVRSANQLLQSEGFYASFFFSFLMRGEGLPDGQSLRSRFGNVLEALADMFAAEKLVSETPFLLKFVTAYMKRFAAEAKEIVDVLMDLSHGVFVDGSAAALWREFYMKALSLDIRGLPRDRIEKARARWRDAVLEDPAALFSRLGPQLVCRVPAVKVGLVAFGAESPLSFDLNTVQQGVLRLVPHLSAAAIERWLAARAKRAFASVADFRKRVALDAKCLEGMKM